MFQRLYWVVPTFGALCWLGTLLGLLIHWLVIGKPHYASFNPGQSIAYISDVGAEKLKPLFIAGSCVTVVCLDLALIIERWARHTGYLAPNTSWYQKSLSIIAIIASIAGALGLILLSIFDTLRHPKLHDKFLILFIVGYVVSAIFICAEYQRLGVKHRQHSVLRASFWIKLFFIVVEVALAIPFGVYTDKAMNVNTAAVIEWVIALVFTFYIFTFTLDLLPAAHALGQAHGAYNPRAANEPVTELRGDGPDPFGPSGDGQGAYLNGNTHSSYGAGSGLRTPPHF